MTSTVMWNRWLWLTLCIALFWRLGLALAVQQLVSGTPGRLCLISGDAEGYWELSGKLARGDDYVIFDPPRYLLRMPGFPLFLAACRRIFGDDPFATRLMLAVVGTVACGFTYWLGRELADAQAGLLAAAYVAVSPTMALFSVLFLSETLFAVMLLLSLIAATRLLRRLPDEVLSVWRPIWVALFTGILVGLATYVRPTWLLVGPGISLAVLVMGHECTRIRFLQAGCVCLGLAITMAPWTLRNQRVCGHLIPTTLWVGPSLYDGLNPNATGDSDMDFFEQDQLLKTLSEYEMDREYRRRAWAFAVDNPWKTAWLAIIKQTRYWSLIPNADQFNHWGLRLVVLLFSVPLFVLALGGMWFARQSVVLLLLTVFPLLYFAALHLLFVGSLRYRLPAEYPLAVLAAVGWQRWNARQRSPLIERILPRLAQS